MAKVKSKTPRAHEAGNPSPPTTFTSDTLLFRAISYEYRQGAYRALHCHFAFSAWCVVLDPPSALSQTYTRPQLTQSPVPRTALHS